MGGRVVETPCGCFSTCDNSVQSKTRNCWIFYPDINLIWISTTIYLLDLFVVWSVSVSFLSVLMGCFSQRGDALVCPGGACAPLNPEFSTPAPARHRLRHGVQHKSVRGVFKKFAVQPRKKTNFTTKRGVRNVTLLKRLLTRPPTPDTTSKSSQYYWVTIYKHFSRMLLTFRHIFRAFWQFFSMVGQPLETEVNSKWLQTKQKSEFLWQIYWIGIYSSGMNNKAYIFCSYWGIDSQTSLRWHIGRAGSLWSASRYGRFAASEQRTVIHRKKMTREDTSLL